jgi:hypothetical protein
MLEKVTSGGQSGVDVAGLIAARWCGIATGGCLPKGFITQEGPRPEYRDLYGVREHPTSPDYPPRTEENVREADATLLFATHPHSRGEKLTRRFLREHKKPFLSVPVPIILTPAAVIDFLVQNDVRVLNVAGNSEHTSPGIGWCVELFLKEMFELMISRNLCASSGRPRRQSDVGGHAIMPRSPT